MKKIKVLHIAQSNGGVAEYLKMFFRYIDKDKFEFDLLCSDQYEDERKFFKSIDYNINIINMRRDISPFSDIKAILQIVKYIKVKKPDIIHLHSSKAGALGRLAAMFFRIPVVYNPHGWAFDMNVSKKKKKLYIFIEKLLGNFTSEIVNISNYEKDCALKYNIISEKKIKVIYNGIEIDKYKQKSNRQEIIKQLGIKNDSFIIGMVGRISEQKSPEVVVEIANRLKNKIKNCYFILVGDGELRGKIEKKIAGYDLNNRFPITGWTGNVDKYISIFDIALLTSKWEGFGLVLTEYMASKKPIVASNVGGIPDVIKNNYSGLLSEYNDIEGFCENIVYLRRNKDFAKEIVNNGYNEVVNKFNIRRLVDEHEKLYFDLKKISKMGS